MLFKLELGSYVEGSNEPGGKRAVKYKANDPERKESNGNIVWSDEDLAATDPKKFSVYRGPVPDYLQDRVRGRHVATAVGQRDDVNTSMMTPEQLEEHASILVQKAAEARQMANAAREKEQQEASSRRSTPTVTTESHPINTPTASVPDREYHESVDRMGLSDMKAHAAERGIDLKGLTTRDQISSKIKNTPRVKKEEK